MKELKIEIGKKAYTYGVPEVWADVGQDGFVALVKELRAGSADRVSRALAMQVCGIELGCALAMGAYHWHVLTEELRWMLSPGGDDDGEGAIDCLLVEDMLVDGVKMVGYEPDFSNTTWEEFCAADSFAMIGNDAGLCSVLYRPERVPADAERDFRIDYSAYGAMNRRERFTHVDSDLLLAARVNYMVLRSLFVRRYPHVFVEGDGNGGGDGVSWSRVTKMIVGDRIGEWEAYNRLPCDVVLSRIESAIVENDGR